MAGQGQGAMLWVRAGDAEGGCGAAGGAAVVHQRQHAAGALSALARLACPMPG